MFACPNCRTRLAKQPSAEGPRWVCTACGGRAVHLPSLRATRPGSFVRRLWALARSAPPAERKRACPICDNLMATVPTLAVPGSTEPLRLDVCVSCQFVWFDPTEHEAWVSSSWSSSEEQLPAETRAALARLPPTAAPVLAVDSDVSDRFFRLVPRGEEFEWKYLLCFLGLPVEVDPPPVHHPPWSTWTLAALVTAVSLFTMARVEPAALAWGLIPAERWRYGGLTLVTSFFLHADPFHLLGNVYFLVVFGDNVEDLLGRGWYLALLLMATAAGDLLHVAADPASRIPLVGASGGIAGIILYYGLLFPRGRLRMLRFPFFFDLRVSGALVLWMIVQLIGAIVAATRGTQVGYDAHLGGALAGLIFWWLNGWGGTARLLRVASAARR